MVDDLSQRIAQIDDAIREATRRGYTHTAMGLIGDQETRRADLEHEREVEASKLAALKVERAGVDIERRTLAAQFGPVGYLADLLSRPADDVLRMFMAIIAILLDMGAVTLLYAATHRRGAH